MNIYSNKIYRKKKKEVLQERYRNGYVIEVLEVDEGAGADL